MLMMKSNSSNSSTCLNDDTFGPVVSGCRDDFDFTVTFEEAIFSIAPSVCFLALTCLRIIWLSRKSTILTAYRFQALKLGTIAVYISLQLALLVVGVRTTTQLKSITTISRSFALLDAVLFPYLSALEHSKSRRPSILFNTYLFLTLLFDATQNRTLWLQQQSPVLAQVFTAAVGVKVAILFLEAQGKQRWMKDDLPDPEETSGIFSLVLFSWLNGLIVTGYRKILSAKDLYLLGNRLSADAYEGSFWRKWWQYSGRQHRLIRSFLVALKWQFLSPVIPRVALGAFAFSQPFLINSVLDYLQQESDHRSRNTGYGLIGAAGLIYAGVAVSNALYGYLHQRSLSMLRACLVTAIYRTTTSLPVYRKDNSAAITLMNSDVNFIQEALNEIHEVWANLIEVAIASWLLERQLGAAFLAPLGVIMFCAAVSFALGKFTGKRMDFVMKMVQRRVSLTASVVSNMTSLKLSGLAEPVEKRLRTYREDEINAERRFRILTVFAAVAAYTPLLISPVITFAVTGKELTVTRVFTSLAYIQLLCNPLTGLFQMIPQVIAAVACLTRVEIFLVSNPPACNPGSVRDTIRVSQAMSNPEVSVPLEHEVLSASRDKTITIRGGNVGWEAGKSILNDINIQIPSSKLTMIVGPVASGKSTLCKALLGEIPFLGGLINTPKSRISYCDQVPFLVNGTIRDNIIGFGDPNEAWYDQVLRATALIDDIATFPGGDKSIVGSNGVTLSGGQSQRVAVARALFARPELAIFDDVLSGLDAKTQGHVFAHVLGPEGLLRQIGATIVFCTHSISHLGVADHIIVLGNQTVLEQGTFQSLMDRDGYVRRLGVKEKRKATDEILDDSGAISNPYVPDESASENEDWARQLGELAIYQHYFSHFNQATFLLYIVNGLVFAFLYNFNTVWLEFWSTSVQHGEDRFWFYLGIYILLQVACVILIVGFFGVGGLFMTPRASLLLHHRALKTLMNAPLSYFTSVDIGVTTNYFSQDISIIDNDLAHALSNFVGTGLAVLGQAAVIGAASPYVMVGYPALVGLLYVVQKIYLRTSRQLRFLELEAKAPLYTHFIETLNGLATIRAFGWVGQHITLNKQLFNESQRPAYLFGMIQQWLKLVLNMAVTVLSVIFITLATQLDLSGPGLTGVGLVSIMSFGSMLTNLVRIYTQLETATGALARLKRFGEEVPDENGDGTQNDSVPQGWPSHGNLEISDVSAGYEKLPRSSANEGSIPGQDVQVSGKLALRNISLSIAAGERVFVCGRTGSGKSSLVLLLQRFLTPLAGHVIIDNLQLDQIPHSIIRQRMTTLPQKPFLLPDGSKVRDNLDLSISAPLSASQSDDAAYALQAVGLWDLIQERGGLDSELNPDSLSQGQKQLFCLARAVLRSRMCNNSENTVEAHTGPRVQRGILILDEFESNVDSQTNELMQAIVHREFAGYTVICVGHRLDTVLDYDRVVVMEKGKASEVGKPGELLRKSGSKFRELWLAGRADEDGHRTDEGDDPET